MTSKLSSALFAPIQARSIDAEERLIDFAARYAKARNPKWTATFEHLNQIAEGLESGFSQYRIRSNQGVKQVSHAAVQHGKTTLIQAFVLWCLRQDPTIRIGYGSFNNDRAEDKMWQAREVAERLGIRLNQKAKTKTKWYTEAGGFVYAGGIEGGTWTGDGLDIIVMDDVYKGAHEADSAAHRARVMQSIDDSILTRGQDWTSYFLNMARWNPQDASSEFIKRGWPYVCLPAIKDDGQPLWPSVVSLEKLIRLRDGDPKEGYSAIPQRTWWSLYQGRPRTTDGKTFDPSHLATYTRLPDGPFVEAMGLDLAYGSKKSHDRSAFVVFRRYLTDPRLLYRVECDSRNEGVELYSMRVAECQLRRGGNVGVMPRLPKELKHASDWIKAMAVMGGRRRIPARMYTSTTESGTVGLMSPWGATVEAIRAGVDKLSRAQGQYSMQGCGGYTAAWAEGRIVVPAQDDEHGERWRIAHSDFTGLDGCQDDEVDASVAAYDKIAIPLIPHGAGSSGRDLGERAWGGERLA